MTQQCVVLAGGGTGGHVFPLVAVAEALRKLEPSVEAVFVGTAAGLEARIVTALGYRLELMKVRPIRGGGPAGALQGIGYAAAALAGSFGLLRRIGPRALLSIGGYVAGPVSLAAAMLRLPFALLEPNAIMGMANRLVAPLAHRAYTAFDSVERHFDARRVVRTGVPIRGGFEPRPWRDRGQLLRILVLGGSQGAKPLNQRFPLALKHLDAPVAVRHQCGEAHVETTRAQYFGLGFDSVEVLPFIDDMPAALADADLVVGRSGAGAIAEICAVGRASLLVPFPYAAGNHQEHNARRLEKLGAARCLPEAQASEERFATELAQLLSNRQRLGQMAECALRNGQPDAASNVAADLLNLAGIGVTGGYGTSRGVNASVGGVQ